MPLDKLMAAQADNPVTIAEPALLRWYGFPGDKPVTLSARMWVDLWCDRYFARRSRL